MTCTSLLDFAVSPAARCVSLSVFPVWSCLCWCILSDRLVASIVHLMSSACNVFRFLTPSACNVFRFLTPSPFPDLPRSSRSCFLLLACQWPFWKAQHVLKSMLPCYHVVWLCLFFLLSMLPCFPPSLLLGGRWDSCSACRSCASSSRPVAMK